MRTTYLSRLFALSALLPAALWAAGVWESKPFNEWTDKDLLKVVNDSPWARQTRAMLSNAIPGGRAGASPEPGGIDASSGGATGNRRQPNTGGGAFGPDPSVDIDQPSQSSQQGVPIVIRWQTALPLRQAQMRGKYGKEAATSPEAQKYLEQEPNIYVIAVAGLPGLMVSSGAGDQAKQNIGEHTTLTIKGREPLRPVAVQFVANGTSVDVLMAFPRTVPITLEDQEVELASQIGPASVKYKFKLKDMLLRGKLEL
jgi:hypothetical protein